MNTHPNANKPQAVGNPTVGEPPTDAAPMAPTAGSALERYFAWREMNNGHLSVPEEVGPHYSPDSSLADWWETKEEAMAAYEKFVKRHEYRAPDALVLIEIYRRKHE